MPVRPLRAAALAAGFVLVVLSPTPTIAKPDHRQRPPRHVCDRTAYVVGDSRRTLEHKVLPRTTDLVWARQLGIQGGSEVAGMRHVRYLAEPGVVHAFFAADLAALMGRCSSGERPLVFDFMGTNYAVAQSHRIFDDSFYAELEQTVGAFYRTNAPQARVVLAELTFDRSITEPALQAAADRYLDGYNGALRHLAQTDPKRFFFLPAPSIYDGSVTWRDIDHETAVAPLADYLAGAFPGPLDADGVRIVTEANGDPCALLDDERFGVEGYSEGATLGAYLQDFRRSKSAQRWLRAVERPARIELGRRTATCTY